MRLKADILPPYIYVINPPLQKIYIHRSSLMRGWHEGATCRAPWIWVKRWDVPLLAFCAVQHHVDDDGDGVHDGYYDDGQEDANDEVVDWSGSEMRQ